MTFLSYHPIRRYLLSWRPHYPGLRSDVCSDVWGDLKAMLDCSLRCWERSVRSGVEHRWCHLERLGAVLAWLLYRLDLLFISMFSAFNVEINLKVARVVQSKALFYILPDSPLINYWNNLLPDTGPLFHFHELSRWYKKVYSIFKFLPWSRIQFRITYYT